MSTVNATRDKTPAEKPVLLEAINFTLRTMEHRTRLYRNLVVCVSLTTLGSLVIALVFRRWIALMGWLALPVFVGCFLYLDARTVRTWRARVCEFRDQRGLQVLQLEQTLTGFGYIPPATLRSMFALLSMEEPKA